MRITVAEPCTEHPSPAFGCRACIAASQTREVTSDDAPPCPNDTCGALLAPIDECPHDAAAWSKEHEKTNAWCSCCGEFFRISDESAALAQAAWDAYVREELSG